MATAADLIMSLGRAFVGNPQVNPDFDPTKRYINKVSDVGVDEYGNLIDNSTNKPVSDDDAFAQRLNTANTPYARPGFGTRFFNPQGAQTAMEANNAWSLKDPMEEGENDITRDILHRRAIGVTRAKTPEDLAAATALFSGGENSLKSGSGDINTQISSGVGEQGGLGQIQGDTNLTNAQTAQGQAQFTQREQGTVQDTQHLNNLMSNSIAKNIDPLKYRQAYEEAKGKANREPLQQEVDDAYLKLQKTNNANEQVKADALANAAPIVRKTIANQMLGGLYTSSFGGTPTETQAEPYLTKIDENGVAFKIPNPNYVNPLMKAAMWANQKPTAADAIVDKNGVPLSSRVTKESLLGDVPPPSIDSARTNSVPTNSVPQYPKGFEDLAAADTANKQVVDKKAIAEIQSIDDQIKRYTQAEPVDMRGSQWSVYSPYTPSAEANRRQLAKQVAALQARKELLRKSIGNIQ